MNSLNLLRTWTKCETFNNYNIDFEIYSQYIHIINHKDHILFHLIELSFYILILHYFMVSFHVICLIYQFIIFMLSFILLFRTQLHVVKHNNKLVNLYDYTICMCQYKSFGCIYENMIWYTF